MEYELQYTTSPEIFAVATRRYCLNLIGWLGLVKWIGISVVFLVLYVLRLTPEYNPMLIIGFIALPMIWTIGYITLLRRAYAKYNQMESKVVTCKFTEENFAVNSDLGKSEIKWRMMDKVQQFPEMWFLHFGRGNYVYLPMDKLTTEIRELILTKASELGLKVK